MEKKEKVSSKRRLESQFLLDCSVTLTRYNLFKCALCLCSIWQNFSHSYTYSTVVVHLHAVNLSHFLILSPTALHWLPNGRKCSIVFSIVMTLFYCMFQSVGLMVTVSDFELCSRVTMHYFYSNYNYIFFHNTVQLRTILNLLRTILNLLITKLGHQLYTNKLP